jgi:hypothetical protein
VSLLADVSGALDRRGVSHAAIGAAALAAHGVPRATTDIDLLTLEEGCLDDAWWAAVRSARVSVDIRRGDAADPLAGVVRFVASGEAPVDLVVGRHAWQRDLLGRAVRTQIGDAAVPVVRAEDLVLLKLYAGGPQDAWDIDQLLDVTPAIASAVDAMVTRLPADSVALWRRIVDQRRTP